MSKINKLQRIIPQNIDPYCAATDSKRVWHWYRYYIKSLKESQGLRNGFLKICSIDFSNKFMRNFLEKPKPLFNKWNCSSWAYEPTQALWKMIEQNKYTEISDIKTFTECLIELSINLTTWKFRENMGCTAKQWVLWF